MKQLTLCALVLCVFALPGVSLATESPVPPVPVVPDLKGTWYLTLTGIAPTATSVTSGAATLTLTKVKAGFYTGSITWTVGNVQENATLVQEGADVRFTLSRGGYDNSLGWWPCR